MAPTLDETASARANAHDSSPDEGSVVSLGPEEDVEMTDVGVPGATEAMETSAAAAMDVPTYVLIHGHSFSFGLGDLRLWLRLPATTIVPSSITGIYPLVQADYRVDYFFEVQNAEDAELLLRAGERHARSSGARYLSHDSFERATMGLRRSGLEVSPPPENLGTVKPKLPSFKRNVPPRTPPEERRVLETRGAGAQPADMTLRSGIRRTSPPRSYASRPLPKSSGWAYDTTYEDTRVRRPRDQDNERGDKALPLPHIAISGPLEEGSPSHCMGTDVPSPHLGGEVLPRDATIKTTVPQSCDEMTRDAALPRPKERIRPRSEPRAPDDNGEPALARRLTDPTAMGRMAARTTWDVQPREPPTAPRAERTLAGRMGALEIPSTSSIPLQERLTDPGRTLLDRLRPAPEKGKRALMERMEVGLKDRISTLAVSGHKRAHNRPKKRLERLLRLEEEILREREEFQWTDAEIDWYIDQEESLPVRSDDDDNKDQMDVD
ncbi:hypothetical protein B0H14DRAFT_3468724 [Mycena olivaceomarginata]|nr:hypothetical protein B0H14DRAFT_3468724 [Mycena olivaceomarginata]